MLKRRRERQFGTEPLSIAHSLTAAPQRELARVPQHQCEGERLVAWLVDHGRFGHEREVADRG
jgi:hypothetical protein